MKKNNECKRPWFFIGAAVFVGCSNPSTPCTSFEQLETPSVVEDKVSEGHTRNSLISTGWERGNGKGVQVYLPTDSWGDGVSRSIAWRLCEFDEKGQLQKIHPQTIRTETVNMQQLFSK